MNYALFCYILNDNLVYEHTQKVSADEQQEEWQALYIEFKAYWFPPDSVLTPAQKVVQWMREYFSGFSFDTHRYQLKTRSQWVSADIKPPANLGVLVFIPDEDNHMTTGEWDISGEWVLLDEDRRPTCEVTHWQLLPEPPKTT